MLGAISTGTNTQHADNTAFIVNLASSIKMATEVILGQMLDAIQLNQPVASLLPTLRLTRLLNAVATLLIEESL
jgi:hypothetical protein